MNLSPFRPALLLSRILGYARGRRATSPDPAAEARWENEGGSLGDVAAPVAVPNPPISARRPPRVASRRSLSLLLFAATAFIVGLGWVSDNDPALTLLPATFIILFVLTVASLRRP